MLVFIIIAVVIAAGVFFVVSSKKSRNTETDHVSDSSSSSDSNTTMFVTDNSAANGNTEYLFSQNKGAAVTLISCSEDEHILEFRVEKEIVIGRSDEADVIINFDNSISKKHCTITYSDGKIMVNDLQSANKTYINNIEITQMSELRSGDVLRLGRTSFNVDIDTGSNE